MIEQRDLLSSYLDGELPASERQALEQHLASCEACREELDALRQVRALLRALPSPALPRSFTLPESGTLPTTISRASERPRSRPRVTRIVQWVGGVAAAAGFALMIGSAMLARGPVTAASSTASNAFAPAAGSAAHIPAATPTGTQNVLQHTGGAGAVATPDATAHLYDRATATPAPSAATNGPISGSEMASAAPTVQEVLPYAGAGLASGGLLLLVGGSVVARRQRS